MKLLVFGATGGTGRALLEQGIAAGHEMAAFVRDRRRLGDPPHAHLEVIEGSVLDEDAVTAAVRERDAVLSCLGTRPWRHTDICAGGTRVIARAMAAAGVKRLIVLSSQGVGDSTLGALGRVMAALALRRAFRDKLQMEAELGGTALDWTVVRPGLLTNGAPRGAWRTAVDGSLVGSRIARADVAAFMLQQLASDEFVRRRPVLVW